MNQGFVCSHCLGGLDLQLTGYSKTTILHVTHHQSNQITYKYMMRILNVCSYSYSIRYSLELFEEIQTCTDPEGG